MLTKEEATTLYTFLDRTPITGHQERQAMNILVSKLNNIANPLPEPEPDPEPEEPDDD